MFKKNIVFKNRGWCPICESKVVFSAENNWFRDHLLCSKCKSIPRERALMHVINTYYPNYKNLCIHESSLCQRGTSPKLQAICPKYSASHFFADIASGEISPEHGFQSENLEKLTFADETFDLFITQDVMEHIFNPGKAFKEIARVLKPGGAHIFTVPIINKGNKSECWAEKDPLSKEIIYHHEPEYHGNPVDNSGSLVTMHWGYDLAEFIVANAGTPTTIVMIDNIDFGIRAEYIEVLISRKY